MGGWARVSQAGQRRISVAGIIDRCRNAKILICLDPRREVELTL
jgi:hypothetical protein